MTGSGLITVNAELDSSISFYCWLLVL